MEHANDGYYGPALPPSFARKQEESNQDTESSYGPALPPKSNSQEDDHITQRTTNPETRIFGPTLPPGILQLQNHQIDEESDSSEDGNVFGPLPPEHKTATSLALEERALEIKLSQISQANRGNSPEQREEWMLKPPEIMAKIGVEKKTKFSHSKCEKDHDQSGWTETPADRKRKAEGHKSKKDQKKDLQLQAEKLSTKKRDAEQEYIANKLKKKHKRDKSLLELHSEKRKKEKETKPVEQKRIPFNRETDLKLNKFDSRQLKSVIDKAKILDSRFSSGSNKYL